MPAQFGVPDDIIAAVCKGKLESSAYFPYMQPILADRHVIGINNAYRIGPLFDIVFFGDNGWYKVHRLALAKCSAIKLTSGSRFAGKKKEDSEGIRYLGRDRVRPKGISKNPERVSWNQNSGAASISIAAHFGATRIILLGFDMKLDQKAEFSHWHGSHGNTKPPPFARHLQGFSEIAKDAKKMGIEILNASPDSVIKEFKKIDLRSYLAKHI